MVILSYCVKCDIITNLLGTVILTECLLPSPHGNKDHLTSGLPWGFCQISCFFLRYSSDFGCWFMNVVIDRHFLTTSSPLLSGYDVSQSAALQWQRLNWSTLINLFVLNVLYRLKIGFWFYIPTLIFLHFVIWPNTLAYWSRKMAIPPGAGVFPRFLPS